MDKRSGSYESIRADELADRLAGASYAYQLNFFKKLGKLYFLESQREEQRGSIRLSQLLHTLAAVMVSASKLLRGVGKTCQERTGE